MDYRDATMDRACRQCGVDEHDDLITKPCAKCSHAKVETTSSKLDGPSLLDRVRYMREAAAVERCHKRFHLTAYPVGSHTHDLVSLLIQCWREAHDGALPRAELLVAAQIHDHPERVVGDIDSLIKNLLCGAVETIELNVERWLGLDVELTEEEKLYLIAADKFELFLWCYEEKARGNATFMDWADEYGRAWEEKPLPWPFMDLRDEVLAGGLKKITNSEMLEIGGL
jgi:5'-deoxynucleotidase YfbR-like HD superfamily hydrolase